ncbi:hypothetical protein D5R81_09015 [Parashewanella spongiae]|uniref:Uncharacterized protein n=1 Tax=Parashewanella spongiae TaxID=342950 RepID=A0A3A6U4U1_9GAMM|nr:ankyrin repeat domain-containing protein [Parashewanella spongiae]MCL1077980.1 ankyrin repeat domain-containing protein [Parashewanella spongiae]RJY16417.1 hypothetical protein D5R81_09015 [Parashewanella spongiae]
MAGNIVCYSVPSNSDWSPSLDDMHMMSQLVTHEKKSKPIILSFSDSDPSLNTPSIQYSLRVAKTKKEFEIFQSEQQGAVKKPKTTRVVSYSNLPPNLQQVQSAFTFLLSSKPTKKQVAESWLTALNQRPIPDVFTHIVSASESETPTQSEAKPLLIATLLGNHTIVTELLSSEAFNLSTDDKQLALYLAIKNQQLNIIKTLVNHQIDINLKDIHGLTPLMHAAKLGFSEIVDYLLKQEINVNDLSSDQYEHSALSLALKHQQFSIAATLIPHSAESLNQASSQENGWTPLCFAAFHNKLDLVKLLVEHGADVSYVTQNNFNLLTIACLNGENDVAYYLLEMTNSGIDLCLFSTAQNNYSPLKLAIKFNHVALAEKIIDVSLSLESKSKEAVILHAKDANGNTPILYATRLFQLDLIKLLIQKGANPNDLDKLFRSPLMLAIQNDNLPIAKLLLEKSAEPSSHKNCKETILNIIITHDNLDMLKLLHKYHPLYITQDHLAVDNAALHGSINVLTQFHQWEMDLCLTEAKSITPIDYAFRKKHIDIIQFLLQHSGPQYIDFLKTRKDTLLLMACYTGLSELVPQLLSSNAEDIDVCNDIGSSPLIMAAGEGHVDIVQKLIEAKAKINTRNKDGDTALMHAVANYHLQCVEILCQHDADLGLADNDGCTPMFIALMNYGKKDNSTPTTKKIIDLLLEYETKKSLSVSHFETGQTPGVLLAIQNNVSAMRILKNKGVDLTTLDGNGWSYVHVAAFFGSVEVLNYLLEQEPSLLNTQTTDGFKTTPIMSAVSQCQLKVVECLLDKNPDLEATNPNGKTALQIAELKQAQVASDQSLSKHAEATEQIILKIQEKLSSTSIVESDEEESAAEESPEVESPEIEISRHSPFIFI